MFRVLILFCLMGVPLRGAPDSRLGNCARMFARASGTYIMDVARTGGLRLLLKPADTDRPQRGFFNWAVREPTVSLTNRLGLGRLEPTLISGLLLTLVAFQGVDAVSDEIYEQSIQSRVTHDAFLYDDMMENDFRFSHVKARLDKGEIGPAEARIETYWLKLAFDRYYEYRASRADEPVSLENEIKYMSMFPHLREVVSTGVKKTVGFRVPDAAVGQLSEEKVLDLFSLNHSLLLSYQQVVESLKSGQPAEENSFSKQIIGLWRAGRISRGEAQHALQEDSYWRHRFAEWRVIGVTRLNVTNGEDLKLQDVREEILRELARGS